MTTVAGVMTRGVRTMAPSDTVVRAAQATGELNVGVIPVCDGQKLVGMVTDRDIVVRGVAPAQHPKTLKLAASRLRRSVPRTQHCRPSMADGPAASSAPRRAAPLRGAYSTARFCTRCDGGHIAVTFRFLHSKQERSRAMRFSAAIQPTAPRGPAPAARPVPPTDDSLTLPAPQAPLPASEVPPDLDQRVRLTGEW